MLSTSPNFFQTKRSLSEIKAELLPAYFKNWIETVNAEEVILADLNAGNGYEANGEKATALQILENFQEAENATETEAKTLKLFLNDPAKTNLEKLKQSLEIPEEEETKLPENIAFLNEPETRETLLKLLQKVPGLVVADPFSYALAQEIVAETIQNTTADLFLLFDFKKLEKTFLAETPTVFLSQLFRPDLPKLKAQILLQKSAKRRQQFLIEQLENSFRKQEFYLVTFRIDPPEKTGNAFYLLLASKSKATSLQAKEFLKNYSEFQEDGVPLFGVNLNYQPVAIPGFSSFLNAFSLESLTQELAMLKAEFHYKTIREVYEAHSVGKPFVLENYLAAFRALRKAETVNLVDVNNKKVPKATAEAVVFYRLHRKQ